MARENACVSVWPPHPSADIFAASSGCADFIEDIVFKLVAITDSGVCEMKDGVWRQITGVTENSREGRKMHVCV